MRVASSLRDFQGIYQSISLNRLRTQFFGFTISFLITIINSRTIVYLGKKLSRKNRAISKTGTIDSLPFSYRTKKTICFSIEFLYHRYVPPELKKLLPVVICMQFDNAQQI